MRTIVEACQLQVIAQRAIQVSGRGVVSQQVETAARVYSSDWSAFMAGQEAANDEIEAPAKV